MLRRGMMSFDDMAVSLDTTVRLHMDGHSIAIIARAFGSKMNMALCCVDESFSKHDTLLKL